MEGKNWDEFEKYKCKLQNRWHKTFSEEKSKKQAKEVTATKDELNEIKEYIEKIRKLKSSKMKANF